MFDYTPKNTLFYEYSRAKLSRPKRIIRKLTTIVCCCNATGSFIFTFLNSRRRQVHCKKCMVFTIMTQRRYGRQCSQMNRPNRELQNRQSLYTKVYIKFFYRKKFVHQIMIFWLLYSSTLKICYNSSKFFEQNRKFYRFQKIKKLESNWKMTYLT